jgi:hypothetical protein
LLELRLSCQNSNLLSLELKTGTAVQKLQKLFPYQRSDVAERKNMIAIQKNSKKIWRKTPIRMQV